LDGEASLLAKALTAFKNDLQAKLGWVAVEHELAIIGPAGACDGCKDKIRQFKAAWQGYARKAGYPREGTHATLTVSFYYVNSHYNRNRKNPGLGTKKDGLPTKYGWREAIGAGNGFVRTFGKTVA
jgi:hypothetical protein